MVFVLRLIASILLCGLESVIASTSIVELPFLTGDDSVLVDKRFVIQSDYLLKTRYCCISIACKHLLTPFVLSFAVILSLQGTT